MHRPYVGPANDLAIANFLRFWQRLAQRHAYGANNEPPWSRLRPHQDRPGPPRPPAGSVVQMQDTTERLPFVGSGAARGLSCEVRLSTYHVLNAAPQKYALGRMSVMNLAQTKLRLRRETKQVARVVVERLPDPMAREIKSIHHRIRRKHGQPRVTSAPKRQLLWSVPPELEASTYSPEEQRTILHLENAFLKQKLRTLQEELKGLAQENGNCSHLATCDISVRDAEAETTIEPRLLVERYLEGQDWKSGEPRLLIVTLDYPDVGREYGNGFVHRRIRHYMEAGLAVDVIVLDASRPQRIYVFDGVRVLWGRDQELPTLLQLQDYANICIHFLNPLIWRMLERYKHRQPIHVFLHGYECDHWMRRVFNYSNASALDRAISRSIDRQAFWQDVRSDAHQPGTYVFVSEYWKHAVQDDMEITFPAIRSEIIHNVIDVDLFSYAPKDPAQRFKILWVRSAANRKYGNDIAIDILKRLSRSEYWHKVEVTIIGDGLFFHEFEKELGTFSNVRIEQRFATQEEIATLHKAHGIFLVPSRLDAQGVSRDEAMSSGMVPVTNMVTAIPEFVDEHCAIVAGPEDSESLAKGILRLFADAEKFLRMSKAAAARSAGQCGPQATISKELALFEAAGKGS